MEFKEHLKRYLNDEEIEEFLKKQEENEHEETQKT